MGPAQAAAIAFGAVLARGLLAFAYFPLVGEVSPVRKYAHNVVLLTIVGAAGLIALSRVRREPLPADRGDPPGTEPPDHLSG